MDEPQPDKAAPALTLVRESREADPLVLLVDDVRSFRHVMTRHHCPTHGRVCVRWVEAESSTRALEILEAGAEVDVIVSDLRMPMGVDGLALLEMIGQRWPNVKRILVSGWTTGEMVMRSPFDVRDKREDTDILVDLVCRRARGDTL